jgi:L-threonylcarbamoyladenylate synthase
MKDTIIVEVSSYNIDERVERKLQKVASILKSGGTVAFPTETVYGLGANALDESAVKKIFEAKGRPSDNPLIIHLAEIGDVKGLVKGLSKEVNKLMESFWPGPLTLVLEKTERVPSIITGGLSTVAIRMPSHPIARKLIKLSGVPVAAPSANISGKPSPTRGEHVVNDLKGKVDAIVMGGNCEVGLESTVLDMTGEIPVILRPGGITRTELEKVLGRVEVDKALSGNLDVVPKAPGMKYTHYAPEAEVYIIKGRKAFDTINELVTEYEMDGKKAGILCFDDTYSLYHKGVIKSMGDRGNFKEVASNLFRLLREFDDTQVDIILAEAVEEVDLGQAIMNRLTKAAGYRIIEGG